MKDSLSITQRENGQRLREGFPVRRCGDCHEATVYIPTAKNSILGHCDSSRASHVTQRCLVPSCQLNNSARVQWRECLQQPQEGEPSQGPDSGIVPTQAGLSSKCPRAANPCLSSSAVQVHPSSSSSPFLMCVTQDVVKYRTVLMGHFDQEKQL